jgi:hypothetical protein
MTLRVPKIPIVSTGFRFDHAAEHQTKRNVAEDIVGLLKEMRKSTVVSAYQEMFTRFIAAVPCADGVRDFARLPYPAGGPRCLVERATKLGCVYTLLSWVVQKFWDQQIDGTDNGELIGGYVAHLRAVWAKGVDKCVLVGSASTGWVLEVPE